MEWLNLFGLAFVAAILIPNILYAAKCPDGFENRWTNKAVELIEQIGRYGCFAFMIFQVPGTWFGWWSEEAFAAYLIGNAVLTALYCGVWIVCFRRNTVFRALALSILPSAIFLLSGILSRSVLLLISALLFAPAHVLISYRNAKLEQSAS